MGAEGPVGGGTFIELAGWRKLSVRGEEAGTWLNDLVSADLSGLGPGEARRSLMLSPTGRIRAEFHLAADPAGDSSCSRIPPRRSVATSWRRTSSPRRSSRPIEPRTSPCSPCRTRSSAPMSRTRPGHPDRRASAATASTCSRPPPTATRRSPRSPPGSKRATAKDLERRRVFLGIPRLGVDAGADLPVEARLDAAAAESKGCYLGQEAVAKVRNLGHPRRLLLLLSSDRPVSAGDAVLSGDRPAGRVTSAAAVDGAWWAMARVGWGYREDALTTSSGAVLA